MTNIHLPSDSYFYFLHKIILQNPSKQIIYVAKDQKQVDKMCFNLNFCKIKNPFTYINHISNEDAMQSLKILKSLDLAVAKSVQNFELFFYLLNNYNIAKSILPDCYCGKLLISDFDTFFTTQSPDISGSQNDANRVCFLQDLKYNDLIDNLVRCGYERVSTCENFGEFSVRGEIIDILKPKTAVEEYFDSITPRPIDEDFSSCGYRLQFFGDKIEEAFAFSLNTQRRVHKYSQEVLGYVSILPIKANYNCFLSKMQEMQLSNNNVEYVIIVEPFLEKANETITSILALKNAEFIFIEFA